MLVIELFWQCLFGRHYEAPKMNEQTLLHYFENRVITEEVVENIKSSILETAPLKTSVQVFEIES